MNDPAPTVTHILPIRVYYEDTDAAGIVYHANFLRFGERARTERLRAAGYDHPRVMAEFNLNLIVRHIEIDYRASGRLDDLIQVHTEVAAIGNTSLTMRQTFVRDAAVLAVMKVVIVAVSTTGRAVRIPAHLRRIFEGADAARASE